MFFSITVPITTLFGVKSCRFGKLVKVRFCVCQLVYFLVKYSTDRYMIAFVHSKSQHETTGKCFARTSLFNLRSNACRPILRFCSDVGTRHSGLYVLLIVCSFRFVLGLFSTCDCWHVCWTKRESGFGFILQLFFCVSQLAPEFSLCIASFLVTVFVYSKIVQHVHNIFEEVLFRSLRRPYSA